MNEKVLIVPMQPTPNGRMHIGHGAGTYLRSDVMGRALRVRGYDVSIITGSDAFENWVIAEAMRSGKTPEDTCDHYHSAIFRDLSSLDIQLDAWIDPRSSEHYSGYLEIHEKTLLRLKETGSAKLENERVPYSTKSGEPMIGTWISGRCPQCGQSCQGSSCVYCGAHFQPEELIEPKSRLDNSTLEWRSIQSWFARPKESTKILECLEDSGIRPVWMKAVKEYIEHRGGRIRLTGPGNWGIESNLVPPGFVLSNPYYLYSVYCGEVYKKLKNTTMNPFNPHSKVTTIGVFGNDNSTPGLIAPHVIAHGSDGLLKPFDITVVNGMLFLEGQKCSTSKRHGIWLVEILDDNTGITSDELRFFLAHAQLDIGHADITLEALVNTITSFREWYVQRLIPTIEQASNSIIYYNDRMARVLDEQAKSLNPRQLDLPSAVTILKNWMYDNTIEQGEWLLGLTLLGAPIFPELAQQIWAQLGLDGTPTISSLKGREAKLKGETKMKFISRPKLSVTNLKPYVHLAEVKS
ncbi:hypothetical protein CS060_09725 [Anoxybacillus flavithermus]|uniref:Methionyl/Leucyl tRNA synthetase domain-containing protein n=1 Tax=Anoxybacillus flavithermus TaxID=33934 RepID=A0A2G5RNX5_9BACL|nr:MULTISPECIES: class I tRNA ligase family protein [Anoxybacillus]PIC04423.1 hypothetical protein CS060_09725 [Anoxybacillus flavithermus]